ncbi:MAG TPA: hypothetical protein EYQ23_06775 [Verrucomicrobiales bacterium]|nr:hypothetical protein [Verrucomicrobiales bacterium]
MMKITTPFLPVFWAVALKSIALCPAAIPDGEGTLENDNISSYYEQVTKWINDRVANQPNSISKTGLQLLLNDSIFCKALSQRQFIAKLGAEKIESFAKGSNEKKAFLSELLLNTEFMEHSLEGATPIGRSLREQNNWSIPVSALEIWHHLLSSDPDAKSGIYLKLAIATGLNPPGTGNGGAGQAKTPETPLARYRFYKNSHQNEELFPSFDTLSVWEYRQMVSSNASNADLAWGRKAINTWRPDLRNNELVVNSTSEVWRRNSPIPFKDTFKNVLAGGGKCGPRSSWSVFICQAFGIPAVGVRQPGHVCATYKSTYPNVQPQPGNSWKVVYGRGWHVSKTCGLPGEQFMEEMAARSNLATFMRGERLRWLSGALQSQTESATVLELASSMPPLPKTVVAAPAQQHKPKIATKAGSKPRAGTIRIEAVSFSKATGISTHDCFTGGKQIHNAKYAPGWGSPPNITWTVRVPSTGTYELTLQAAVVNVDQAVNIAVNDGRPVPLSIPNTHGLWQQTLPLTCDLKQGANIINLTRPATQRGLALRYLEFRQKP